MLLFQGKSSGIYKHIEIDPSTLPFPVLEWVKREGEEFYFYKTTDELITYIGQISKHFLAGTDKENYILCPINSSAIKTTSRNLYKTIVDKHMLVMNMDGNKQNLAFDKNIIHFKLMEKEEALKVFKEIIKINPTYLNLKEWINNEF